MALAPLLVLTLASLLWIGVEPRPERRFSRVLLIVACAVLGAIAMSLGRSQAPLGVTVAAVGALIGVPVFAVLLWPTQSIDRHDLDSFARQHCLVVTAANGPRIVRYLTHSRRWRRWGALGGLAIAIVVTYAAIGSSIGVNSGWFFAAVGGYFMGDVAAEFAASGRERRSGMWKRVASLTPRRRAQYVQPRFVVVAGAAAVATCALAVASISTDVAPRSSLPLRIVVGVAAVGCAVLIDAMTRRIVRRPQSAAPADVVAADDAIRANAANLLSGAGLSFILFLAASEAGLLSGSGGSAHPGYVTAAWLLLGASVLSWITLRRPDWMVRRQWAEPAG